MPHSCLPPKLSFSSGTLLLERCPRQAVERVAGSLEWAWDNRAGAWRIDALHYADVRRRLDQSRLACDDSVAQWHAVGWPRVQLHPLRPEQREAVEAWRRSRRACVVMPTGAGKTEVALSIIAEAAVSTLVVAPVRDLMYQWHRRILHALGYDAGVIGDRLFRVRPVSVTTYESAYLHMDRLGDRFGLIVFDECHHLPGAARRDAALMCAAPFRLGLTATPERSDGRQVDLPALIGPISYELPLAKARGKTLAEYEVVRIPVYLSADEQARYDMLSRIVRNYIVARTKSDLRFSWEDVCGETAHEPEARRAVRAFYAKKAIEDRAAEKLRVLEDLFRLHAGSRTIVFAGSNSMARDVSRRFLIPCLLNHCGKKERLDILSGLEDGSYPAVVANRVLDEGVDLPAAKVAVVLGGTSSTRQARQRLGRILRKSGNARATLYEVVCGDTNEDQRSRRRRATDAYQGTRHRRL